MNGLYDLNEFPVCPYCSYEEKDAWEIGKGISDGGFDHNCGSCGKWYRVYRWLSVSYGSAKIEEGETSAS